MLRSLYAGVTGLKGFQTKMDVVSNNIANVNTIGYKKSRVTFQDLLSQNLSSGGGVNPKQVGLGVKVGTIDVLHAPGSPMTTGVSTDLSIQGDGFFVVQNPSVAGAIPNDGTYLTRAGNFYLNDANELVTAQGFLVLDYNEDPIVINEPFEIDGEGVIRSLEDGSTIATIGVAIVDNPQSLQKAGDSFYEWKAGIAFDRISDLNIDSRIVSGQLEMSNVDLTEEFTEMIIAQRGFQSNSRVITTSDEILQEIVNLKR